MLILTSLILVLIVPLSKTSHINFMFPFLIYGYLLKKFTNKINYSAAIITGVTFIWLYLRYWSIQHTVYLSPLNTLDINQGMIYSFLLRLLIGITGSTFIFIIAKYLDKSTFVQKISVYGRYTLVFYTMTTVINGVTRRIFSFMDFEILNPLFLDVSSICFALLQMYIIYNFAKVIEKKHILSKLLLGN